MDYKDDIIYYVWDDSDCLSKLTENDIEMLNLTSEQKNKIYVQNSDKKQVEECNTPIKFNINDEIFDFTFYLCMHNAKWFVKKYYKTPSQIIYFQDEKIKCKKFNEIINELHNKKDEDFFKTILDDYKNNKGLEIIVHFSDEQLSFLCPWINE